MKTFVLAFALLAAGTAPAFAQTTLANWTFENSPLTNVAPAVTFTGNQYSVVASSGTGTSTGSHATATTVWSSPAGNGSAKSLSANTWSSGDYFQFQTSATNFSGLKLSWDQAGSSTGPKDFGLYYSTNGSSFTQFGSNYSVIVSTWSAGTPASGFSYNYDLSSVTALDNAANVYFRLIDMDTVSIGNGVVATGGTDRVDNFTITAIPEPSTYAFLMGAATTASVFFLRRRQARTAKHSIA